VVLLLLQQSIEVFEEKIFNLGFGQELSAEARPGVAGLQQLSPDLRITGASRVHLERH
jgi:hypothetical protein